MSDKQTASLGTIVRGSNRVEHTMPAFMEVLELYDPVAYNEIDAQIIAWWGAPLWAFSDDSVIWDTDQISYLYHEDLFYAMQDITPEGCYFGSCPGDGSDYGFWAFEDDDDLEVM